MGSRCPPCSRGILLLVVSYSSQAAVREVGAIGLTVGDLDRAVEFYTKVLPFEKCRSRSRLREQRMSCSD